MKDKPELVSFNDWLDVDWPVVPEEPDKIIVSILACIFATKFSNLRMQKSYDSRKK